MAKQPVLFLVPIEWMPEYGIEVYPLKARTQMQAALEIERRHEKGDPVPKGHTVMAEGQMRHIMLGLQKALGLRGSVHWVVEDVMEAKHCSRAKAENWLEKNQKHLAEAGTTAGWEVIRQL